MTLQQVIDIAKYGELSTVAVKNNNEAILSYLNMGMLELYKKFALKVEEHIIALQDGVTLYTMPDNFMWIVAAYEEVDEQDQINRTAEIPVNKEEDEKSINTVGWRTIQIPLVTNGAYISVIYIASPTWYTVADLDVELDLPAQMVNPLLSYIAYRAHSSIDSAVQAENDVHFMRFNAACDDILKRGMFNNDDLYMDKRLDDKGFV